MNRNLLVKILAVPAGYTVAVLTHAFHNTFGSLVGGEGGFFLGLIADYFGYFIMTVFIIWMIVHERGILKRHLQEEVAKGAISQKQYNTAISFFQTSAHLSALTSGSFGKTRRFYQVLGELAHKKEQLHKVGNESDNMQIIERYRAELMQLAPVAKA
jgi:hypothetical protein